MKLWRIASLTDRSPHPIAHSHQREIGVHSPPRSLDGHLNLPTWHLEEFVTFVFSWVFWKFVRGHVGSAVNHWTRWFDNGSELTDALVWDAQSSQDKNGTFSLLRTDQELLLLGSRWREHLTTTFMLQVQETLKTHCNVATKESICHFLLPWPLSVHCCDRDSCLKHSEQQGSVHDLHQRLSKMQKSKCCDILRIPVDYGGFIREMSWKHVEALKPFDLLRHCFATGLWSHGELRSDRWLHTAFMAWQPTC